MYYITVKRGEKKEMEKRATAQSGRIAELEEIRERLQQRMGEARRSMFNSTPNQQEAYYDGKATAFTEAIEFVSEVKNSLEKVVSN